MSVLWRLPEVGPALLRHVLGYGSLATAASGEWARLARTRLTMLALAWLCGLCALGIGCAWFVVSAWALPQRHWIIAGGLAVLLTLSLTLGLRTRRRPIEGEHMRLLRAELAQDREWLEQLLGHP